MIHKTIAARIRSTLLVLLAPALLAALPATADSDVFVTTTADFETGSTAILRAGSAIAELDPLSPIHGDSAVRFHDGRVYVIERFLGDNIIVLDSGDPGTPLVQFSVGNGANPQDIAFANPTKAYISLYGSAALLIVDPRDGTKLGEIDLSSFADEDGIPEMGEMAVAGTRLYVALQRLDFFVPTDRSLIAVIDMETDTVIDTDPTTDGVQALTLATTNPNEVIAMGGRLFVSNGAGFGDLAGGIEVIDLATNTGTGVRISEEDLGGDLTGMAIVSPQQGFAVVQGSDFVTYTIHPVDLETGVVGLPLAGHSGGFTPALVVDGDRLIVADFGGPEAEGGLLIYDANDGRFLEGPISTGLPPVALAVMAEMSTAVEEAGGSRVPDNAVLLSAYPNPFNAAVAIRFHLDKGFSQVALAVFDSLGRRVRTLVFGPHAAGRYTSTWDGRNEDGGSVATGTYVVQLRAGGRTSSTKIVLIK